MEFMYNPTLDLLLLALSRVMAGDSDGAAQYYQQAIDGETFADDVDELQDLQEAAAALDGETYERVIPDEGAAPGASADAVEADLDDDDDIIEAEVVQDEDDDTETADADDVEEDEPVERAGLKPMSKAERMANLEKARKARGKGKRKSKVKAETEEVEGGAPNADAKPDATKDKPDRGGMMIANLAKL